MSRNDVLESEADQRTDGGHEDHSHAFDFVHDFGEMRRLLVPTVFKGSIRVSYGVCTISVRFLYDSTTVHGATSTDNQGKRRWHYGQSRCYYGSRRCLYGQAGRATGSYCLRFDDARDNDLGNKV